MNKYEILKLENQLCFPLYAASREIIKLYKPFLDKFNLTYTQYITMLVMWEDEKITVKQLGEKLHLDSGTLSPLLKKLEAMGLVTKYRDKQDDRVVIIELTEKGSALRENIAEVTEPDLDHCKFGMEPEKLIQLKQLLDSLLIKFD
jgi:DNA-binding MarR family transcriptional regulator